MSETELIMLIHDNFKRIGILGQREPYRLILQNDIERKPMAYIGYDNQYDLEIFPKNWPSVVSGKRADTLFDLITAYAKTPINIRCYEEY